MTQRGGASPPLDEYTPVSSIIEASLPTSVTSLPHVMQTVDEFAISTQEAATLAFERGDLKTLTRLLNRQGKVDIPLLKAFKLAVQEKDLEAIDALHACDARKAMGDVEDNVVPILVSLMEKGERVVALHIWKKFYGGIESGSTDEAAGWLAYSGLVPKAIEFGYPEILTVLLNVDMHCECDYGPYFNQERFDMLISRAVTLGDHGVWDAFVDQLPLETLNWALEHDFTEFHQHVAHRASHSDCIDQCVIAIQRGLALPMIQLLHAACSPIARHELQMMAASALGCARQDVLDWILSLDSFDDIPFLVLMCCETVESFDAVYGRYGDRIPPTSMQAVFVNACSRNWKAVVELITERFEVTKEWLDTAFVEIAKQGHVELLQKVHSMGISADRYDEAFKVTSSVAVAQFLALIGSPSRETATLAVANCLESRPYAVEFMEWVYDRYSPTESADALLIVAGKYRAISFVRKLFRYTTVATQKKVFLEAVDRNYGKVVSELTSLMEVSRDMMVDAMELMRGKTSPVDERMQWAHFVSTSALQHALTIHNSKKMEMEIRRILESRRSRRIPVGLANSYM